MPATAASENTAGTTASIVKPKGSTQSVCASEPRGTMPVIGSIAKKPEMQSQRVSVMRRSLARSFVLGVGKTKVPLFHRCGRRLREYAGR